MARNAPGKGVDPALKKAIAKLLKDTMVDPQATLTDKMKVIDRALKLSAIEAKLGDDGYGAGFTTEQEGED